MYENECIFLVCGDFYQLTSFSQKFESDEYFNTRMCSDHLQHRGSKKVPQSFQQGRCVSTAGVLRLIPADSLLQQKKLEAPST